MFLILRLVREECTVTFLIISHDWGKSLLGSSTSGMLTARFPRLPCENRHCFWPYVSPKKLLFLTVFTWLQDTPLLTCPDQCSAAYSRKSFGNTPGFCFSAVCSFTVLHPTNSGNFGLPRLVSKDKEPTRIHADSLCPEWWYEKLGKS